MKRMMIALLLLAVSLPVAADPPACPCYSSLQIAGTCLRFLDEDPGVYTKNSITELSCESDSMRFNYRSGDWPAPTGKFCIWGVHNLTTARGTSVSSENNLSTEEYDACRDELAEAAELLGLNP